MGIGYHVKKALDARAAAEKAADIEEPFGDETPAAPDDDEIVVESAPIAAVAETPLPSGDPSLANVLQSIVALIAEVKSSGNADAQKRTLLEAERLLLEKERLMREMPENKQAPLISVYNQRGDRDHPKPDLRCKTIWAGYEIKKEGVTRDELELLNQLSPGDYEVTKADGTRIPFVVSVRKDNAGQLELMNIWFPTKDEQRNNHAAMISYLREALHGTTPNVSDLLAEIAQMKADLATARAGVGA